jgi:hypothetical protein
MGEWKYSLDVVEKRKVLPLREFEPRPFSQQPIAIPTELIKQIKGEK